MPRQVLLTASAEQDIEDIYDYFTTSDSLENAKYVLAKLSEVTENLADFPESGSCPNELLELGIREYRQVFFKPYRVISRVMRNRVVIHLIADGRRDMPTLLARRLLGG